MAELDYYSVMQKRIEYFAKKYDPYNRLTIREEIITRKEQPKKPKMIRQGISTVFSTLISFLF
ncbi:MAG: hypothetical protein NTW10_15130 [Bacteroidetes bacterium]|nr:hypothetical protein [Bacteroidota bacterium]